jgi:hypothetical protein
MNDAIQQQTLAIMQYTQDVDQLTRANGILLAREVTWMDILAILALVVIFFLAMSVRFRPG